MPSLRVKPNVTYIWNSSSESEYKHKLDFFISKLINRGYEKSEVLNCLTDISYNRRNIYLEDVPKIKSNIPLVFSTNYFPQRSNAEIKQTLIRNCDFISKPCQTARRYDKSIAVDEGNIDTIYAVLRLRIKMMQNKNQEQIPVNFSKWNSL